MTEKGMGGRPKGRRPVRTVTVELHPDQYRGLKHMADVNNTSLSAEIRAAVGNYLRATGRLPQEAKP